MKQLLTFLFVVIIAITPRLQAQSRYIVTIAGSEGGYFGDNGPALAAELHRPSGVAQDDSGNVYIADQLNNAIRKIKGGIITTIAGSAWESGTGSGGYSGDGGPATLARLFLPTGVAIDTFGNIYIADQANNRVRKVDTGHVITTIAGTGVSGYSGDGAAASLAQLASPVKITLDPAGDLFIADELNHVIRKIDATSSNISTVAGNNTLGYSGDGGAAIAAQLNNPTDIALDAAGNMYIADHGNHAIRKVDASSGNISSIAGFNVAGFSGDGGPATNANLYYPTAVVVDLAGNVYISDWGNACIREIDAAGIITTIAGNDTGGYKGDGGPATACEMLTPQGMALNWNGNIYLADEGNNRIRLMGKALATPIVNAPAENLQLYPNPSNGRLTVSFSSPVSAAARLIVSSITGQQVMAADLPANHPLDIQLNAPPGIYFLAAVTGNGTLKRRIVVE